MFYDSLLSEVTRFVIFYLVFFTTWSNICNFASCCLWYSCLIISDICTLHPLQTKKKNWWEYTNYKYYEIKNINVSYQNFHRKSFLKDYQMKENGNIYMSRYDNTWEILTNEMNEYFPMPDIPNNKRIDFFSIYYYNYKFFLISFLNE